MSIVSSPRLAFARLLSVLGVLALALVAWVVWDATRSVEALWRENDALHSALSRLQAEETAAYFWLLHDSADGRREIAWLEVPAGADELPAHFHVLPLQGREVFFDALVVRVPGELVADGEGRALLLWRRAFGSAEAPETGVALGTVGTLPRRYASLLGEVFTPPEAARFWEALWDLAHDPDRLAAVEVEAIHGNALSIEPRPGFFYTVRFSATGTLSLRPAPMSEAPAFLPPVRD